MSVTITEAEWLAELERVSMRNDPGRTAREWAEAMKCSVRVAHERLGAANRQGMLIRGDRTIVKINGRPDIVPVYRLKGRK